SLRRARRVIGATGTARRRARQRPGREAARVAKAVPPDGGRPAGACPVPARAPAAAAGVQHGREEPSSLPGSAPVVVTTRATTAGTTPARPVRVEVHVHVALVDDERSGSRRDEVDAERSVRGRSPAGATAAGATPAAGAGAPSGGALGLLWIALD